MFQFFEKRTREVLCITAGWYCIDCLGEILKYTQTPRGTTGEVTRNDLIVVLTQTTHETYDDLCPSSRMLPTLPYVWLVCLAIEEKIDPRMHRSLTTRLLQHRTPGSSVRSPYLYVVYLCKQES